jgi:hypothetical protein
MLSERDLGPCGDGNILNSGHGPRAIMSLCGTMAT